MTSNRFSLETFGPELMQFLLAGSRNQVVIGFPTKTSAQHFMARIHRMRSAMKNADHPDYPVAARARVSVWQKGTSIALRGTWLDLFPLAINKDKINGWANEELVTFIVIDPHDSEFANILSDGRSSRIDPHSLHHEKPPAQPGDDFLTTLKEK